MIGIDTGIAADLFAASGSCCPCKHARYFSALRFSALTSPIALLVHVLLWL
jgi:hypothetical protein